MRSKLKKVSSRNNWRKGTANLSPRWAPMLFDRSNLGYCSRIESRSTWCTLYTMYSLCSRALTICSARDIQIPSEFSSDLMLTGSLRKQTIRSFRKRLADSSNTRNGHVFRLYRPQTPMRSLFGRPLMLTASGRNCSEYRNWGEFTTTK